MARAKKAQSAGLFPRPRPTWDETWMKMVLIMGERSQCIHYKVGAVIAKDKRIISVGYNGPVVGEPHCVDVGCAKMINGKKLPVGSGRCRGAHAELNALNKAGLSAEGASAYINFRPCFSCTKQLINAGVKRVVFLAEYDGEEWAKDIFRNRSIDLIPFSTLSKLKLK